MSNVILLFKDSTLPLESYQSLIGGLVINGYEVDVDVPKEGRKEVHILSHGDGCDRAFNFIQTTTLLIDKIILAAPTHNVGKLVSDDTLLLWSDNDKKYNNARYIRRIYKKVHEIPTCRLIGYPNVSFFLFAGVYYSQQHDLMDAKKIPLVKEIYEHIDPEILQDIVDFYDGKPEKKKVCLINELYLPFMNGVNVLVGLLKNQLEQMGLRPYVYTFALKDTNYIKPDQERNVILIKGVRLPGKNLEESYSKIMTSGYYARRLKPYGFDYLHLNCEYTLSKPVFLLAKFEKIPLIYTQHTLWDDFFIARIPRIIINQFLDIVHYLYLFGPLYKYDVMTVPTQKVAALMEKKRITNNVVVLPGCVDEEKFKYKPEHQILIDEIKEKYNLKDKKVMGYLGRVAKEKNIDELLVFFEKIAPIYPNLVFLLVGGGPHFAEVEKFVEKSEFKDRIHLVGNIQNDYVKHYFRCFDFFTTSSTFETQGLTYLEAILSDALVIARQDPCLDGFLTHDVNCLLFNNFDEFKNNVNIIMNNPDKVKSLKEQADITREHYTKSAWAKKYKFLYEQAELIRNGQIKTVDIKTMKTIK